MKSLAILGAGGHGRVVADCAEAAGWDEILFFDDNPPAALPGSWRFAGSGAELLARLPGLTGVVVAIGANFVRLDWHRRLSERSAPLVSLVHPGAWVSPHAEVGPGSVVFAGAVVNVGTRMGEAVIINTGATVDHDCALADGVHISPGAHLAGGVSVGEASWVGIGAVVRELVVIGERVKVGAGSAVVSPVASGLTVVGVPARPIRGGAGA
jgi:sugar O-acyltransferase (sialic acid O-acetyltransferase NeuD family)